jgi:hypothetical protein
MHCTLPTSLRTKDRSVSLSREPLLDSGTAIRCHSIRNLTRLFRDGKSEVLLYSSAIPGVTVSTKGCSNRSRTGNECFRFDLPKNVDYCDSFGPAFTRLRWAASIRFFFDDRAHLDRRNCAICRSAFDNIRKVYRTSSRKSLESRAAWIRATLGQPA